MEKEFRYTGKKIDTGAFVRGRVTANNTSEAKKMISSLAKTHDFRLEKLEKKKPFLYKAVTPGGKKINGEQEAFSANELKTALENIKMTNIKVEPVLLNINMKPPFADIVMFVTLTAEMLRENMRFDEILKILSTDTQNKTLKKTIKGILSDLRQGMDSMAVFSKYSHVFGKFTSYMLGLASKSGNMAQIYESTAKFLNRQQDFKKNLRQALVMPGVTMVAITIAVWYYVAVLFPEITEMFIKFNIDLPPMTAATLKLSYFLQDNWWWLILLFITPILSIGYWFNTPKGKYVKDRLIISLPIVGGLIHKMSIEIFFRVFSTIYTGSGNNMEVIQLSAESCGNVYMESKIKEISIPMMLKEGAALIDSLEKSEVFTETVISRLNAGSATGSLKKSAEQIAMYYEKETGYKFRTILNWIDVFTATAILIVMTALIIVSSESAFIRPPTPGM